MDSVGLAVDQPLALVTLNRPDVLNAVDAAMLTELQRVLTFCAGAAEVSAVIVRGAGRSFCSGIDLTALAHRAIPRQWFADWERAVALCEEMPKPVVCAVHGNCLGGGLQIALACDVRIATVDATFELPAIQEGLIPGFGVYRLPRYVGLAQARRMVLLGERLSAPQAQESGLVDLVVADRDELLRTATARARELVPLAAVPSFAACKQMLSLSGAGAPGAPDRLLAHYLDRQGDCLDSDHRRNASAAWLARSGRPAASGVGG
jgi:enoyl-CoA hydratase/carnithine racemase